MYFTDTEVEEIKQYLERYPLGVDWSYDSELDAEQVNSLLAGDRDSVNYKLWEWNIDYIGDLEWQGMESAISDLLPGKDLDYPDCIHELQDREVYPHVDMNIEALIRNSRPYICVGLRVEHDPYYEGYDNVADELDFWGVNPHDIDTSWPDIPNRTPLIDPKHLAECWLNCGYYGEWYALLDGPSLLALLWKEGKLPDRAILKSGAWVTIYDYMNGAGSTLEPTGADLEIETSQIYNDGQSRYGIQSCYGLSYDYWDGEIELNGRDKE